MFNWLRGIFLDLMSVFAQMALWCYQSTLPLDGLGDFFVDVEWFFADVSTAFYRLDNEWDDLWDEITSFLNWGEIYQNITSWIPNIEAIRDWFFNWWNNTLTVVLEWWDDVVSTVQEWIEQGDVILQGLISNVEEWLSNLQNDFDSFVAGLPDLTAIGEWFSDWWANILVNLNDWWDERLADVQGLIDSAFASWSPFWEGWIEVKDSVIEFVCDPVEFIWTHFANWFLGEE